MNAPSDSARLRRAMGCFLTGVTVVTTRAGDGSPRGFTANSFSSVSLHPPLVSVCLSKAARSFADFAAADGFAVNILADDQRALAEVFASRGADKFASVRWREGANGLPLIDNAAAVMQCESFSRADGGDHIILLGRVADFAESTRRPLGFYRGHYLDLGLERKVADASGARIGVIAEGEAGVLFVADKSGGATLPTAKTLGGDDGLLAYTARLGARVQIEFLFAAYENAASGESFVFYRGAVAPGGVAQNGGFFAPPDKAPWDKLPDAAMRGMLSRYFAEREAARFGVYVGGAKDGEVRMLA